MPVCMTNIHVSVKSIDHSDFIIWEWHLLYCISKTNKLEQCFSHWQQFFSFWYHHAWLQLRYFSTVTPKVTPRGRTPFVLRSSCKSRILIVVGCSRRNATISVVKVSFRITLEEKNNNKNAVVLLMSNKDRTTPSLVSFRVLIQSYFSKSVSDVFTLQSSSVGRWRISVELSNGGLLLKILWFWPLFSVKLVKEWLYVVL